MEKRRSVTRSLGYMVGLGVTAKFFVDVSVQLFQPFLTIIAAGMGLSVITMGRLVSLRNLMGLSSPLIGTLADRIGYRAVMRFGLLSSGVGFLLLASGAGLEVILVGMVVTGVGVASYTPMVQAYLSAKLPYSKRSRFLGILEYSWALAGIMGLFLMGFLIEWFDWRLPLLLLSGGFFAMALLFGTLPTAKEEQGERNGEHEGLSGEGGVSGPEGTSGTEESSGPIASVDPEDPVAPTARGRTVRESLAALRKFLDLGEHKRSAWAAILINLFNFFAVSHVMIIHGGWLEAEYGLRAGQLGTVALLLGFTDWTASILVSIYGDRIGKKRSVFLGVSGMVVFFGLLPLLNLSLPLAVISIALPRFCFEFAIVSNFPLISEQFPEQRGKVMALSFSMGLLGPVISGMSGPAAYLKWGVWGLGPVSFFASLVSMFLLLVFVREEPYARADCKAGRN